MNLTSRDATLACLSAAAGALLATYLHNRTSEPQADARPIRCAFKAGEYGLGSHPLKNGKACVVRRATPADAAAIRRLVVDLARYEKEDESTIEATVAEIARDGRGPAPLYRCLLAEVDGKAVGFALHFHTYSTWQGKCIYLEDLFVSESCRGLGLGGLLLKTTVGIAHSEGCRRVNWQALDWNTPALDFYKTVGAQRMDDWVNLRMTAPEMAAYLGL